ncbi:DNA primase family protein [Cutibacterium avidum]|uniref:DNA primase family protein n=1 Tax=Cutibacterium avidum TaxID=33010 RepID=UPI002353CD46|nr:phage/plasmid primase, P4 family [Cutibacterium avidum]
MKSQQTSLNPNNDGAQVWEETLQLIFQADAELIGYVQRICGLAAIGKVMIEALIIAYGDGANGKSTFWNTIARVLGNYADSISADVLIAGKKNDAKNDMAETRGKRLLIAAETEEGRRLSTSAAKQLASTDKIAAEKKYKDPFAFTPSHTLVLYTNHLPKVGARDAGIWRRLIVIPFEAKIEGSSDIKNYADHLYTHAGGAILAWVMEGARLIHAENYQLHVPAKVHAAIEAYRAANDWFAHFLEECCQLKPGLSEKSGAVYDAYRSWALARGEYVRSTTDFYAEIDKAGFNRRRTNSARMIDSLALISEFTL